MSSKGKMYPADTVFSLDIGTRSIVGTVGYMEGDFFHVIAQSVCEHQTRSMLDGQIHDIAKVSETIGAVKSNLENKLKTKLKYVCIAAAGRVLKTQRASAEISFTDDTLITKDLIYELESAGTEKAYEEFQKNGNSEGRFYCVGHSVIKYYMNDLVIGNLENHKARKISIDLIATFLPYDVVEGLYTAVEMSGLEVVNLTLEPIAAIQVAIPDKFRMLNIALVDVGAGTSDICITKEGSVSAYGMIPVAGDSLTEIIAQNCLVDFETAERIKTSACDKDKIEYEDIMGLPQTVSSKEVLKMIKPQIEEMTRLVSETILELNGDKPVSAIFVVGGGGKIEGYTNSLADKMDIPVTRVALRGEDVMQKFIFEEDSFIRDSLMVTPLGICLNFYKQNNNFIFVSFNDERIKLYDNGKLRVVDALMQAGPGNDDLFPKRGKSLKFLLNGKEKEIKGELGEACVVTQNGDTVDLYKAIHADDILTFTPSSAGSDATIELSKLLNDSPELNVTINSKNTTMPRMAMVNGELKTGSYSVCENDNVEILDYYTVEQIYQFLDYEFDDSMNVSVNNAPATRYTQVYSNFVMEFDTKLNKEVEIEEIADDSDNEESKDKSSGNGSGGYEMPVVFNGDVVLLKGKDKYVYVDIFDFIDFDLTKPHGSGIETLLNGSTADFLEELNPGDKIDIFWKD